MLIIDTFFLVCIKMIDMKMKNIVLLLCQRSSHLRLEAKSHVGPIRRTVFNNHFLKPYCCVCDVFSQSFPLFCWAARVADLERRLKRTAHEKERLVVLLIDSEEKVS